ncbi:MAG: hypothetical protein ACRYGG_14585 [Janthinobacterium lividum]
MVSLQDVEFNTPDNVVLSDISLSRHEIDPSLLTVGSQYLVRNYEIFHEWSEITINQFLEYQTRLVSAIAKLNNMIKINENVLDSLDPGTFQMLTDRRQKLEEYEINWIKLLREKQFYSNLIYSLQLQENASTKRSKLQSKIATENNEHQFQTYRLKPIPSGIDYTAIDNQFSDLGKSFTPFDPLLHNIYELQAFITTD